MDENGKVVPQEVKGWNWGHLCSTSSGELVTRLIYRCYVSFQFSTLSGCSLSASKATVGPGKKAITKTLRHSKLFKQLGIEPVSSNLFYQLF